MTTEYGQLSPKEKIYLSQLARSLLHEDRNSPRLWTVEMQKLGLDPRKLYDLAVKNTPEEYHPVPSWEEVKPPMSATKQA